jgi:predicted Zn-dependent protease
MRLRSAALAIGLVAWWPLVSTGDDGFRAGGSYPLHVELVRVFGELSDDRYARIVERVGRRAVEARGAKPDRFRFTLLDSPELRAFALPGGFAYVTRGLLATFDSEAQLERTLADLLPEAERADPGRRERDALFWAPFRGIGWPAQDGPRVALPDLVDRALERARSVDVAELPPSTGEERAAFLAELDGLPVGPDPAHGVLEPDGRYLHTGLGFRLQLPAGWRVRHGPRLVVARSARGDAALEVTSFPTLLGAEVVAERSLTDMERERKLDVVDLSRASGAIGGLPYVAFEYRLVRARREHPVRCVWIQDRRRLYRLLGVVELDVLWRSPGLVERIQGSFRRARADEPSELAQLRLRLHVAGDGETLEGVAARYPGGWSAAELATLNRLDAAAPLSSGALLKVVRLEPLSEKPAN